MRKFILPLLASLAVATPALADTRAEVRGGAIWSQGTTEATYGAAIGFDGDLGPAAFYGLELSGDKIDQSGTKVAFGLTGRLGLKAGPTTRVFGLPVIRPSRATCANRAITPVPALSKAWAARST